MLARGLENNKERWERAWIWLWPLAIEQPWMMLLCSALNLEGQAAMDGVGLIRTFLLLDLMWAWPIFYLTIKSNKF
jgi:hypothetical protein